MRPGPTTVGADWRLRKASAKPAQITFLRESSYVKEFDDYFKNVLIPRYQQDTGIKPEWAAEAFDDLEEDVRQSLARIKASPFIPNKSSIRGFVYELETGRLREVSPT